MHRAVVSATAMKQRVRGLGKRGIGDDPLLVLVNDRVIKEEYRSKMDSTLVNTNQVCFSYLDQELL